MKTILSIQYSLLFSLLFPCLALAANTEIDSFNTAKRLLETEVYPSHRKTLYCGATFKEDKSVIFPSGFQSDKYQNRKNRIEWEHVVPAENFGRTFSEWREGHPDCVNRKGKAFKGRKCAEKTNKAYRYMQADLYNLFPAIGSVNAMRSNFNFTLLPDEHSDFGACVMKIENKKAEPPIEARGRIARTYLYMESAYSNYSMSKQQRQLMSAWDAQYPISDWECERGKKIEAIQGSSNPILESRCQAIIQSPKDK